MARFSNTPFKLPCKFFRPFEAFGPHSIGAEVELPGFSHCAVVPSNVCSTATSAELAGTDQLPAAGFVTVLIVGLSEDEICCVFPDIHKPTTLHITYGSLMDGKVIPNAVDDPNEFPADLPFFLKD